MVGLFRRDTYNTVDETLSASSLTSYITHWVVQTQDKQEQLNEALVEYSRNGLPKIPDLLTLGRPVYNPSSFQLERHWTDIVDRHDSLTKRQRDQQEAIWELLSTEVEYIKKLRSIIDVRESLE